VISTRRKVNSYRISADSHVNALSRELRSTTSATQRTESCKLGRSQTLKIDRIQFLRPCLLLVLLTSRLAYSLSCLFRHYPSLLLMSRGNPVVMARDRSSLADGSPLVSVSAGRTMLLSKGNQGLVGFHSYLLPTLSPLPTKS
jgi:hypothetical protein